MTLAAATSCPRSMNPSSRPPMFVSAHSLLVLFAATTMVSITTAFVPLTSRFTRILTPLSVSSPTKTKPVADRDTLTSASNVSLHWNNTSHTSMGSLLLNLKNGEEEAIRRIVAETNNTIPVDELFDMLVHSMDPPSPPPLPPIPHSEISPMDKETARELDTAVTRVSKNTLLQGIQVLPPSLLYQTLRQPTPKLDVNEFPPELLNMPWSLPEHYTDRIGRDKRHLAVSVASSIDHVWQWRLFCEERGGIVPLLQCIRDAATKMTTMYPADPIMTQTDDFLAACTACRSLRDMCALSPEVAAILTDGIVRANDAWDVGPISHLVTILQYINELEQKHDSRKSRFRNKDRHHQREARRRCQMYVLQLLLAMVNASDDAIQVLRETEGLKDAVLASSSFAPTKSTRPWLRYPVKAFQHQWSRISKSARNSAGGSGRNRSFLESGALTDDLSQRVQGTANLILAAIGHNKWVPKMPGQKGLRILSIDGGGSRGMTAVTALRRLVKATGGVEVCDAFDIIAGTSTGAIIAFLVGLRRETSRQAKDRYNTLIKRIFVKSALSATLLLFTTASYDETPFMEILNDILDDTSMLDSRADPAVPLVFAVTSKMSSTPTHVSLFRNYNYAGSEMPDSFTVDPDQARLDLGLPLDLEQELLKSTRVSRKANEPSRLLTGSKFSFEASRHPGSFRALQRHALRASTAAPTVFKPVYMGGEIYCDGGIVASNPTGVAIHEARTLFPDVPIELVVSIGTGGFMEEKTAPRLGWDGIFGQIVNSATDGEQVHHILEDTLGYEGTSRLARALVPRTKYYRLNPVIGMPGDFPIDGTDPVMLQRLCDITESFLGEPEQKKKLEEIRDILQGRPHWRKLLPW